MDPAPQLAKLMKQDRNRMGSVNVVDVHDAKRRDTFDEWRQKYGDGKNDNRPVVRRCLHACMCISIS